MTDQKTEKKAPRHTLRNTIIAVAAVIIALTAVLMLTILEFTPIRQTAPVPSIAEQITMAQVLGKFMRSIQQAGSSQHSTVTMEFTEAEINVILATLLRIADQQRKPDDPQIYAYWQQGKLYTEASVKCWGTFVNLRLGTLPTISNHTLQLPVESLSVGKMPLPRTMAEKIIHEQLDRHTSHKRFKMVLQAVDSLKHTGNGNVELILNVPQAQQAIMSLL